MKKKFLLLLVILALTITTTSYAAGSDPAEFVIVIDAGHQAAKVVNGKLTPGKVVVGTQGVSTKTPEYEVNLQVALKLRDKLESFGYKVVLTRETNNVDISNQERTHSANKAKANLFIVLHADGYDDPSVKGMTVFYPHSSIAKSPSIVSSSKAAGSSILKAMSQATGARARGVEARTDLVMLKETLVPIAFVEMGFLTNPTEDKLLSSADYQDKVAEGILSGVNTYFNVKKPAEVTEDTETTEPVPSVVPVPVSYKTLKLTESTRVYDKIDAKAITKVVLMPQDVEYSEKKGDWYKIKLWSETKWIYYPIKATAKKTGAGV